MKLKFFVVSWFLGLAAMAFSQSPKQAVLVNLKDGSSIDALHFGQDKCGKETYGDNYIIIRGKYLGNVTEIKQYHDIEKIVLEGYSKDPVASIGNEKGTVRIFKKNGVAVTLEEAEIAMSCYGTGDKYNTVVVTLLNPLNNRNNFV